MHDHLILVSRERIIGTEIDETSNLIYTEVKIRTKKYDANYLQCKDYKHLVERELTSTEIANFKANRHLYTKVKENEHGTIYQYGKDFKKMYWEMFQKEKEKEEKVKKEKTHKVCSKCKKKLPVTDFYVSNNIIYSDCKKCRLNMYKIRYKELSLQKSI